MCYEEMLTVIKEILICIAAITTTIVALFGLYSWKRELHGKTKFDTARKLVRATYQLREVMRECRLPFTSANEYPKDYNDFTAKNDPKIDGDAWQYIYRNRWAPVSSALITFDEAVIESEVIWGNCIKIKTDKLRQCVHRLYASIDAFISDKYSNGKNFKSDSEFAKSIIENIWYKIKDADQLSIDIKVAISSIEKEIRPHLKR